MDEGGGGKDAEFARAIEGRESSWRRWRGVTNARVGSEYWQWWFDGRRKWIKISHQEVTGGLGKYITDNHVFVGFDTTPMVAPAMSPFIHILTSLSFIPYSHRCRNINVQDTCSSSIIPYTNRMSIDIPTRVNS
uniref:Uncharacterized protein n=1 Tax=Oryza barthii TaxID=65489 RepID=A0A0D3EPA8_9ORYZ